MDEMLPTLNRVYRAGIATLLVLSLVLLAVVTADPGQRLASDDLTSAPTAQADRSGPTPDSDVQSDGLPVEADSAGDVVAPEAQDDDARQPADEIDRPDPVEPPPTGTAPSQPEPQQDTPAPTADRQSDQGVTGNEIVIAFTRIDPAFYQKYGIPDQHAREAILAYVEHINANGGISGRQIRPEIITQSDPRYPEYGQRTCRTAFQEHQAFMIINDARYPGLPECAARLGRPVSDLGHGLTATTNTKALADLGGHYAIAGMASDRIAELWVDFLAKHRDGRDKKFGIIEHYNPSMVEASEAVQRAMQRAGFQPPSTYRHNEDPSTFGVQAQNAASQFKRDGVEIVLPITTSIGVGAFQRAFASQAYNPEWTFSPIGMMDSTDYAHFYDDERFNGTTGISFARLPDQPGQERCRQIFEQRWPDLSYETSTSVWCHLIFLHSEALSRAGDHITTATWSQALSQLKAWEGNHIPTSNFGPNKFDGADAVQVLRYSDGRMEPVSDFTSDF